MTVVCLSANTSWNLFNFRGGLIRRLIARGDRVIAAAPRDDFSVKLAALGCETPELPMDNVGTNPWRDSILLWRIVRLLSRFRPEVFLGYTIKPVIYGGMACRLLGIPYVTTITGLGTVFSKDNALTMLVREMYRVSQKAADKIVFQNPEDQALFLGHGLVTEGNSKQVMGSGVDTSKFGFAPLPESSDGPSFLMVSRLLWEKGVREFVEAAALVRKSFPKARFRLLGPTGDDAATVTTRDVTEWESAGFIEYLGVSNDVRSHIESADCVVLPSYYREGIPRSLLEASAIGRPIITTDSVGCRNVVVEGVNGFLCKPKDAFDLSVKMERFIRTPYAERVRMGIAARERAVRDFDERMVLNTYIQIIDEATTRDVGTINR